MIDVTPFVESLNGKPVAVFGLARSGRASIKALKAAGAEIYAGDDNPDNIPETLAHLDENNIADCAALILAPGVPLTHPEPHNIVKAAHAAGVEIISDIEVLHRIGHGRKTVGVTGTNGKSTTVALIHHILNECGVSNMLGGNIGKAVLEQDLPAEDGVLVLELSSYQIDLCPNFKPDIAVLLNITPDHLDRHGSIENYEAVKRRIFGGRDQVQIEYPKGDETLLDGAVLKGDHNAQNAKAAFEVCTALGLGEDSIRAAIKNFPGLAHRQFHVRRIGGVEYINDSKATNAEAASKALGAYDDIYWVLGGQAKDGGLNGLEDMMGRIKEAFLIGEAQDEFAGWLNNQNVSNRKCTDLKIATDAAHRAAQENGNGTVLLSPACASFDQFQSFEARGDAFVKAVEALGETT